MRIVGYWGYTWGYALLFAPLAGLLMLVMPPAAAVVVTGVAWLAWMRWRGGRKTARRAKGGRR